MDFRRQSRTVRAFWAPSLARRVVRHRVVQLALLAFGVLVAALLLQTRLSSLAAERSAWGETVEVLVVSAPVGVGESVAGDVTTRELPSAFVPAGAVAALSSGALARTELYPGEVLLESRLTGGTAGLLPEGTVAITLALHGDAPLVDEGDLVDVWTVDSANLSSRRVASRVLVLARSDDTVSIAVPSGEISDVTVAALRPVILTLLG